MIKKYFKNPTIVNAGWLIWGKVAQMAISFFVSLITARYLGPASYGLINYAGAYIAFFMAFCTLGINSLLVKEFIDHPEEEGEIIGSTIIMRGISSVFSVVIITCIVCLIDAGKNETIIVTLLCSIGLMFNIFETFSYWFQSKLKSRVTAIATLIAYVITSIYRIILLILEKDVKWFALATSIDYICIGVMLFICYKRYGGKKLAYSKEVSKRILNRSVHFILSGLMVSIYRTSDKFMLKQMINETEVGYYSVATALCSIWCFVLTAIIDSVYPSIMSAHNNGERQLFEKRNRQLYAIVFYISTAVSLIFCAFGKLIIQVLYGNEFVGAVAPLQIITWYTAFSYLGVARNAWIVCENKGKYLKYIYILAAIINVLLNFLFIPTLGAVGAALASLITQIFTSVVLPLFIKGLRSNAILMMEAICLKGLK